MTDEYRAALKKWAAENLPACHSPARVLDVRLHFSGVQRWSEVEDGYLHVEITYADRNGRRKTAWLAEDGEKQAVSLSALLTDLFSIADRQ